MTIKRSQIRDLAINDAKIATDAAISTLKLALDTEFRHSVFIPYTDSLTTTQTLILSRITHIDLPDTLGTSSTKGVVVDETLNNWVKFVDLSGRPVVLYDVNNTITNNTTQRLIGRLTNLQLATPLVTLTGVTVCYIGSNNINSSLVWNQSGSTLTWNSGTPVVISTSGLYELIGTSNRRLIVDIITGSLPGVNTSETLQFDDHTITDEYVVGYFYRDTVTNTIKPVKSTITTSKQVLIPIVYGVDDLPFSALLFEGILEEGIRTPISFSDLVDVTKTSGTELTTTTTLALNTNSGTSGGTYIGYHNNRIPLDTTAQTFLDTLDDRSKKWSRDSFLGTSGFVVQNGADIEITISSGTILTGVTSGELSSIVQSTMLVLWNGVVQYPTTYSHSLVGLVYKIIFTNKTLLPTDTFEFLFQWLPLV